MRKVLLAILLIAASVVVWCFVFNKKKNALEPKPKVVVISKYSANFNGSVKKILNTYYKMVEGFVNWDTAAINRYSLEMKIDMDSVPVNELKEDSANFETANKLWDDTKVELGGLMSDSSLKEKRGSLNILSDNLFHFLKTVRYDQEKLYYQECPMAFGENTHGFWLSKTEAVRNPYLGIHHPKYGKGMLECGEPKDSLNFIVTASTNY